MKTYPDDRLEETVIVVIAMIALCIVIALTF